MRTHVRCCTLQCRHRSSVGSNGTSAGADWVQCFVLEARSQTCLDLWVLMALAQVHVAVNAAHYTSI
jgi:hypothetical protein